MMVGSHDGISALMKGSHPQLLHFLYHGGGGVDTGRRLPFATHKRALPRPRPCRQVVTDWQPLEA